MLTKTWQRPVKSTKQHLTTNTMKATVTSLRTSERPPC